MEFLYSHPMIAVGCSDGVIRLWNFKTKTITKNVNSATKPIIKMQAVARDDPMNSYPLLFALSQDGNLAAHNLDKNIPEYKITNTGTISDFIFHNSEIISVLSNNTVTVRDIRGNVTRQAILPKAKVSNTIVCPVTTCGCIPNWYLFSNNSNKVRTLELLTQVDYSSTTNNGRNYIYRIRSGDK
jgi:WD40 repeat protein